MEALTAKLLEQAEVVPVVSPSNMMAVMRLVVAAAVVVNKDGYWV